MNLRTYQAAALRTSETRPGVEPLTHAVLFLQYCAGTVAGSAAFGCVPAQHMDIREMVKNLGAVLYALSVTAGLLGYTLDELAAISVEDFRDQMGDGCPLAQLQWDE